MKILHVTREWPGDKKYGLGRSLNPLIIALLDKGFEVRYLSQEDLGEASLHWLRQGNALFRKLLKYFRATTQLDALVWGLSERFNMGRLAAKVAASDSYTHVHMHDPFIALGFWVCSMFRFNKCAWGISEHGFGCYAQAIHEDGAILGTRTMGVLRGLERKILLAADWVICPTADALKQLSRDLGVYPVPSFWHAIHHPKPPLNLIGREEARRLLGWSADDFYVIAVGRLVPLKQFDLAIAACAKARVANLHLVLIGEGDCEPYIAQIGNCLMNGRVHFTVTDDVSLYYSAADLYLCSSRTESFGLANLEAMVAGLPIVATAVGGVPEVLGDAAHWVPASDGDAMAVALNYMAHDIGYRCRIRNHANARGKEWVDIDKVSEAYAMVYRAATA